MRKQSYKSGPVAAVTSGKSIFSSPLRRRWSAAHAIAALVSTALLGGCGAFMQGFNEGLYGSSYEDDAEYAGVTFDISPDGRRLVFVNKLVDYDADLFLFDLKTSEVTRVARTPEHESDPVFSNDGKSLLYVSSPADSTGDYVYSRSLETNAVRRLTSTPKRCDSMPRYSPDGSHIVFVRAHREAPEDEEFGWLEWDIYTMRKDGTDLKRITRQNYTSISEPRFSRDGKTIYFSADPDLEDSMWYVYSLKLGRGQKPRILTKVQRNGRLMNAAGSNPDVSRDNKHMVFISDREEPYEYELYRASPNGDKVRRITWHRAYANNPIFTRDGKFIYYMVDEDYSNRFDLWRTDVNGKNARRIADSGLFSRPMQWKKKK